MLAQLKRKNHLGGCFFGDIKHLRLFFVRFQLVSVLDLLSSPRRLLRFLLCVIIKKEVKPPARSV